MLESSVYRYEINHSQYISLTVSGMVTYYLPGESSRCFREKEALHTLLRTGWLQDNRTEISLYKQ
jgi:hypothetical protein